LRDVLTIVARGVHNKDMTNTLSLKAIESNGKFWLYNHNVFVSGWDTKWELTEWVENKGFTFEWVTA
jgi:hypothetical protein